MTEILTALRSATKSAHAQLEAVTLGSNIMDGSLSPAEYTRILHWQERVHQLLEPRISHFSGGQYHYRPRFAGATPPPLTGNGPDRATAIGIIYVLEGSSLGGSIIYRKLQANAALRAYAPFAFYRDQSEWGLEQWKAFVGYLKQTSFTEEEISRATASAVHTFGEFSRLWEEGSED